MFFVRAQLFCCSRSIEAAAAFFNLNAQNTRILGDYLRAAVRSDMIELRRTCSGRN